MKRIIITETIHSEYRVDDREIADIDPEAQTELEDFVLHRCTGIEGIQPEKMSITEREIEVVDD